VLIGRDTLGQSQRIFDAATGLELTPDHSVVVEFVDESVPAPVPEHQEKRTPQNTETPIRNQ